MKWKAEEVLAILDRCCDSYSFPMLDNGYVYLAATRLSLYRSEEDWALVIETFGFSPRAGWPDICTQTFASRLHARDLPDKYVSADAHQKHLANHPNDELRFVHPFDDQTWQDPECGELLADSIAEVTVRGSRIRVPTVAEYAAYGIDLEEPPRVHAFELCRAIAHLQRDLVLGSATERRVSVPPELDQIMQLEEWHHPNVVEDTDRPSGSDTSQQLARVLVTGDARDYRPTVAPNTHWRHWPDGGTL